MKLMLSLTLCFLLLPHLCSAGPLEDLENAKNAAKNKDCATAINLLEPLTKDETVLRHIKAQAFFYLSYCVPSEKQLEYAQNALRFNDKTSEFHYRCAEILHTMKQPQQALQYLRSALDLIDGTGVNAAKARYRELAALCYWEQRDKANAAMNLSSALEQTPNNPHLHLLRGRVLSEDGTVHDPSAVESFKEALRLGLTQEQSAQCSIYLGKLHEYARQLDEASLYYAMAHKDTKNELLKKQIEIKLKSFTTLKRWNA